MKNALLLAALTMLCPLAAAGPLNPPAGAIAATGKTLAEVEARTVINATNTPGDADSLFRITQPGSYILTENLTGVSGKHGIEIAASNVTIDLQGFRLDGVTGSLDGINAASSAARVTVRNGSFFNWRADTIDIPAQQAVVERVAIYICAGTGIRLGSAAIVSDCSVYQSGSQGISVGDNSRVSGCIARSNSGGGIDAGDSCVIERCSVLFNSVAGIGASARCTITQCAVSYNNGNGITATISVTIADCNACNNTLNGIIASNGCSVTGCVVRENGLSGVLAAVATTVRGCTVVGNTGDGINVDRRCLVVDNNCIGNGGGVGTAADGANIHATAHGNRIEGNTCCDADRGIDIDGVGNTVFRNTCSGNAANWTVAAGNVCLVVSAAAGPAFSGNSGGVAPGSTDPNANFSH